jgi:hypothetical protein
MFLFNEVAEDPSRSAFGLEFVERLRLIGPCWAQLWITLGEQPTLRSG